MSFERYGRLYYLDPGDADYGVGDRVLVPTESGPEVAECVWAPEWVEDEGSQGCQSVLVWPPQSSWSGMRRTGGGGLRPSWPPRS